MGEIQECFKGIGKKHKEFSSRFENVPSGRAKESAPRAFADVARALVDELPPQEGMLPSFIFPSANKAYRSLMHHLWCKHNCLVSANDHAVYTTGDTRFAFDDMSSLMDTLVRAEWPRSLPEKCY